MVNRGSNVCGATGVIKGIYENKSIEDIRKHSYNALRFQMGNGVIYTCVIVCIQLKSHG